MVLARSLFQATEELFSSFRQECCVETSWGSSAGEGPSAAAHRKDGWSSQGRWSHHPRTHCGGMCTRELPPGSAIEQPPSSPWPPTGFIFCKGKKKACGIRCLSLKVIARSLKKAVTAFSCRLQ